MTEVTIVQQEITVSPQESEVVVSVNSSEVSAVVENNIIQSTINTTQVPVSINKIEPQITLSQSNLTVTLGGTPGPQGEPGVAEDSFESVAKNLKSYPSELNYTVDLLTSIVYTLPTGTITKTFAYTDNVLTSITLSGSTPSGIDLVKTFTYTDDVLTGISYS